MVRKIFEKAGMIPGLQPGQVPIATAAEDASRPKTAPGTMMNFLTVQSSAIHEAESLKERIKELESADPIPLRVDPVRIRPSKWANRHEASFDTARFQAFKEEIKASGGNVQPIKVRPIGKVLNGSTPVADGVGSQHDYEVIFGHRRHRACLELGLPVLLIVEAASDQSLFEQMERENRGRDNLSAWEQGTMYRKALDDGLYSSLRRLAEGLGVDVSLVSKSVSLARLPDAVIGAFDSPLDIQFRWAAPLSEIMQKDPDGTLERAKRLSSARDGLSPAAILSGLLGLDAPVSSSKGLPVTIAKDGKVVAKITSDPQGRALVKFDAGVLPESRKKALARAIEDFLKH